MYGGGLELYVLNGIVLTVTKLDCFVYTHNLAGAAGHGSPALKGTPAPPFDSPKVSQRQTTTKLSLGNRSQINFYRNFPRPRLAGSQAHIAPAFDSHVSCISMILKVHEQKWHASACACLYSWTLGESVTLMGILFRPSQNTSFLRPQQFRP